MNIPADPADDAIMTPGLAQIRVVEHLAMFRALRPDERQRIVDRVTWERLEQGKPLAVASDAPRMVVVAEGVVELRREGLMPVRLFAGDVVGEDDVLAGACDAWELRALTPAWLATLDAEGVGAMLGEFPSVAIPLLYRLGSDLKWYNDLLRDATAAQADGLPARAVAGLLRRHERHIHHQRRSSARTVLELLARTLVTEPAERPSFWMFAGVAAGLAGARSLVAYIITNGLQKQMFALIGGPQGNPMHIHHFNYGLIIIGLVGVLAMVPATRQALRLLSFGFGVGVGLLVDEFALFWNLNPDYYQPSSRAAAALVLFVLVQVVYFRKLYLAAAHRLVARVWP